MKQAYVYDAVRTPFGKFGGGLAAHRPDDLAAHVVRELVAARPELDPAPIDEVVFGNANGAGEENRNVARMATLLAGLPVSHPGHHRQPALRLLAGRGDHRLPPGQRRRRGPGPGRRRRVDEPRPVGPAQDREALPGRGHDAGIHHAGLAPGEQGHAQGMDQSPWARPPNGCARSTSVTREAPGRVRRALTQPRRRGVGRGLLRQPRGPVSPADKRGTGCADEGIRPGSTAEKLGRAQDRLPRRRDRHGHRRQRLAAVRRRLRGLDRLRARRRAARAGTAGPHRRPRRAANEPQYFGYAPVEAANKALAKAGHLLGRSAPSNSTRPSPRSRWPASTPGASTPES